MSENSSSSNTTSSKQMFNKQEIPVGVKTAAIIIGVTFLVLNSIGNGLLFLFLRTEQKKGQGRRKSVAKTFVLGVVIFSLLAVIALLIYTILVMFDHEPLQFCNIAAFIHDHVLILSFSFCLHFLSCIIFERYTIITRSRFKLKPNIHWFLVALCTYVLVTWLILVAEDFYYGFIKGSSYCYIPKYEKHYGNSQHSFIAAVAVITVWQTVAHTITTQCTYRTVKAIKEQKQAIKSVIGETITTIELKRLKVSYSLMIMFSLIWIPFGIQASLHNHVSVEILSSLFIIMRTTTHASFFVLPTVYYMMEKRFEQFVKETFKGLLENKVGVV